MSKDSFNDGVCEVCGQPGLAGEKCRVCGEVLGKIDADPNDPMLSSEEDSYGKEKEPETYPLEEVDKEEAETDYENL